MKWKFGDDEQTMDRDDVGVEVFMMSWCDQVEEFIMLTDPKLSLFTGMEEDINEADERPQHKITSFRYRVCKTHMPLQGVL